MGIHSKASDLWAMGCVPQPIPDAESMGVFFPDLDRHFCWIDLDSRDYVFVG